MNFKSIIDSTKTKFIFLSLIIGFFSFVLRTIKPGETLIYPSCIFHSLTGFYCPGCGSLRATNRLLHFDITGALSYNIPLVTTAPFLIYAYISYGFLAFTGKKLSSPFIKPAWIWSFLIIIIIYWILRNLPFYPFTLLAPG